jgi:hypothetical protein
MTSRLAPKVMASQLVRVLRRQHPDYHYLKKVFQYTRELLQVGPVPAPKRLPALLLPPVTKCTKTNGLKMYQGQFWANFRRGDSEKVSEPEADGRPFLAGVDGAPHRPPKYEPSC